MLAGRLFQLQVLDYQMYRVLASDQHELQAAINPTRGTIYMRDLTDSSIHPVAKDRETWQVYAVPREMKNPMETAQEVAGFVTGTEPIWLQGDLMQRFSNATGSSFILAKELPVARAQELQALRIPGIGVRKTLVRSYPEEGMGGHVLGFVSTEEAGNRQGKYGIEGAFQKILAGRPGFLLAEKDAAGRRLTLGELELSAAKDGDDVVLTMDRTIQYTACAKIREAVKRYEAKSGSVVILDPSTGAVLAMCAWPDFDPEKYGKIPDLSVLNNPITFYQYEPGSIFKPITMAAGLDAGKVSPGTTYRDTGEENIDGFTIRNSDHAAHGVQTMTQVLEKSLNTGAIYVERLLGRDVFRDAVGRFGFGERTGIELLESKGDISPLSKKGQVFAATASYGQGITVTPLQIATAYLALANRGTLMRPYVVQEVIHEDGTHEKTSPHPVRDAVSERAARLVTAMMVSVVERGHGKKAGVPGYYVAGKTGTAQVPDPRGNGYFKDVTIGSFAGYAPADHPKFVMLVKIDEPKTVQFAESSAAPVFGEMAEFLLGYFHVPPERAMPKRVPGSATSTENKTPTP